VTRQATLQPAELREICFSEEVPRENENIKLAASVTFFACHRKQQGEIHPRSGKGRRNVMLKSILAAAALAVVVAQPAFADDAMMKCDDASMMKLQTDMDAMSGDAMKKDAAMKEMDMAKEAMKANKADDCVMHMDMAMKAMKKG
jgi:hypothetical protein